MVAPRFLFDGPLGARLTVVLAHGAGASMDSPFMATFAEGLGALGHRVARFEFPFMAERRETATRKPPNRWPVLLACWKAVIAELGPESLVIGGKSLGGRSASVVAAEGVGVAGLVCLGYPFHAPGRPGEPRIDHLKNLRTPTLILQGARDPFGTVGEVRGYGLSPAIHVHWLDDGDHGFKPRKASGRTERQNWDEAIEAVAAFLGGL